MKKIVIIALLFCSCQSVQEPIKFPHCPKDGQVVEFENTSASDLTTAYYNSYLHEGEPWCYDPAGTTISDDTIPKFWRLEFVKKEDTSYWKRSPAIASDPFRLFLKKEKP